MTKPPDRRPKPDDLDEDDDLLRPEAEEDVGDEPTEGHGSALDDVEPADDDVPEPDVDEGAPSDLEEPADASDAEVEDAAATSDEGEPDGWEDDDLLAREEPELDEPAGDDEGTATEDLETAAEEAGPDDTDWAALEDEQRSLAPGRLVVGVKEWVAFPEQGLHELVARLDTGAEWSSLRVPHRVEAGVASLELGGRSLNLPCTDGPSVELEVAVGRSRRRLRFALGPPEAIPVVLGRDWLEGIAVVDVALGFVQQRVGP